MPIARRRSAEDSPGAASTLRVNAQRLLDRLQALAGIGADGRGGVTRMAFTPEDHAARQWLRETLAASGLEARTDAGANLVAHRPGALAGPPVLMIGSHIDTVAGGGRLDGAYGVIAAMEVLTTLHERGIETAAPVVAIAFTNEEGATFPLPMWGSRVVTGTLDGVDLGARDRTGRSLGDALAEAGGDLDRLASARWQPGSVAAFLEAHIEQGPVLERTGRDIGVVDAVVGRLMHDVVLRGRAGHAGTSPMDGRRDALVAAARVVEAVRRLALDGPCQAATVGRLDVEPDMSNVVPGRVSLSTDLRAAERDRLALADRELRAELGRIAAGAGVEIEVAAVDEIRPAPMDPRLRAVIQAAADGLGHPWMTLPSGAGHDAQVMATLAPAGMLFVPSRDGISHSHSEHTDEAQLVRGADVLLHSVLRA